jgi:signal transduction histidine kinase
MLQQPSHPVFAPRATTAVTADQEQGTRLSAPWAVLARAGWLAITLLALMLFLAALPLRYAQLAGALAAVRPSLGGWSTLAAVANLSFEVLFVVTSCAVAAVIFWQKSSDWLALLVGLFLVLFSIQIPPELGLLGERQPIIALFSAVVAALSYISLNGLGYLFPTGRFVPHWTWLALLLVAILQIPFTVPDSSSLSTDHWNPLLFLPVALGIFLLPVAAQLYRYRRVSTPLQRQQTKWVVYGVSVSLPAALIVRSLVGRSLALSQNSGFYVVATEPLFSSLFLLVLILIPFSFGAAILRYRLWDIDILINRTLVYGSLTLSIAAIYVVVVGGLGTLFQTQANLLISFLATVLVALLFQVWRDRLQRGVNRLLYGQRDEPYQVLARLGQRLESTLASDALLPAITETIAQALKLPYVAIEPRGNEDKVPIASYGVPISEPLQLALVYQGETIGHLLLATRARGESMTPTDQRLLTDLLPQVGLAVHAARLTTDLQRVTIDLQRSRERLVVAREEERRRLRRDLHDGLGPQLASQALTLTAASKLLRQDADATEALLLDARHHAQEAITDIRRVIYALRPPSLDDLGLLGALREQAVHYQASGVQITIQAPATLGSLPAAVEVACFRIAQEALTNVVRHARARTCVVTLAVEDVVSLEVIDDGGGVPEEHPVGVGLTSMRERAAELGGTCVIEAAPSGGTRVYTQLPLA